MTASLPRTAEPLELDARFRTLVQSPLRAGLLRYLNSREDEGFEVAPGVGHAGDHIE